MGATKQTSTNVRKTILFNIRTLFYITCIIGWVEVGWSSINMMNQAQCPTWVNAIAKRNWSVVMEWVYSRLLCVPLPNSSKNRIIKPFEKWTVQHFMRSFLLSCMFTLEEWYIFITVCPVRFRRFQPNWLMMMSTVTHCDDRWCCCSCHHQCNSAPAATASYIFSPTCLYRNFINNSGLVATLEGTNNLKYSGFLHRDFTLVEASVGNDCLSSWSSVQPLCLV